MKIQAVAFDLDDTLLREDRTISDYTVSVLRRAADRGIKVIPASGRVQGSMLPFVKQMDCAAGYISGNGSEVWSKEDALLHRETMTVETARSIAAFAEAHDCHCQVYYGDMFFSSRNGEYARQYESFSMLKGEYVGDLVKFIDKPTCKLVIVDSPARVAEVFAEAKERFAGQASVTCSLPYLLEFNPLLAGKGNGLRRAADLLGFDLEHTAAFGDGLNDLSMLTCVGLGVAVDNAWAEVKKIIPTHCRSNREDGVARFIEENILKEDNL